jgi:hypothetical protein
MGFLTAGSTPVSHNEALDYLSGLYLYSVTADKILVQLLTSSKISH